MIGEVVFVGIHPRADLRPRLHHRGRRTILRGGAIVSASLSPIDDIVPIPPLAQLVISKSVILLVFFLTLSSLLLSALFFLGLFGVLPAEQP